MNGSSAVLGQIAGILVIAQAIPYIITMLNGKTRPSRASYAIWSVIQVIAVISYVASGATDTKWVPVAVAITAVIIFGLSFKYGMGGLNKLDIVCLVLAAVAIGLWVTTNNPELAVYASLIASSIAYIPTIKKAFLYPETENRLSWVLYLIAVLINVCAITTLEPVIALPPIISLVLCGIVAVLLIFHRKVKSPSMKPSGV